MSIQARYSGTCSECGGRWQPGDLIRCDRTKPHTDGTTCWQHASCPDVADPLIHDHPVCERCFLSHPPGTCDR